MIALGALAHETRLAVFRLLVGAGPAGMSAGGLARALDTRPTTLSFHLRHLAHAGLVASTREGRSIRYRANFSQMDQLLGYLSNHCCGGDPSACLSTTKARDAACISTPDEPGKGKVACQ